MSSLQEQTPRQARENPEMSIWPGELGALNKAFLSNTGSEESLNKAFYIFYFGWDAFEGRSGTDPERVLKRSRGSKNQSHSKCLPHAIPFFLGKGLGWGGSIGDHWALVPKCSGASMFLFGKSRENREPLPLWLCQAME